MNKNECQDLNQGNLDCKRELNYCDEDRRSWFGEVLEGQVVEYLRCLFDINRTRYTKLEELTYDIEAHTKRYLREMTENI